MEAEEDAEEDVDEENEDEEEEEEKDDTEIETLEGTGWPGGGDVSEEDRNRRSAIASASCLDNGADRHGAVSVDWGTGRTVAMMHMFNHRFMVRVDRLTPRVCMSSNRECR